MNQDMIPASALSGIFGLAVSKQINLEDLLLNAGIEPGTVGSPDAFLTAKQLESVLAELISASNDPAFGLHYGKNIQYNGRSLVEELVCSAGTLREALRELVKYKDLLAPGSQFQLAVGEHLASISYQPGSVQLSDIQRVFDELIISRLYGISFWLTGGEFSLVEVRFSHPQPSYVEEYQRTFKTPIFFNSERNELIFRKEILDVPLSGSLPDYHGRIEQLAEEQLNRLAMGSRITRQVLSYLKANIGIAAIGVEDAASHLNMTARTLQRKLKQEGVSFAELRDQLRHDMAQNQLQNSNVSMGVLASHLGFSDASTFYHAFKRWEGVSPGEYRRQRVQIRVSDYA